MNTSRAKPLAGAVAGFVHVLVRLSDEELGREQVGLPGEGPWQGYRDTARELIFQVYQDLCAFATDAKTVRAAGGTPMTAVGRILGRHQEVYRDLHGVLAGARDDELDRPPREGEWPLRIVIGHMMHVEWWGFQPQIRHALERRRAGETEPASLSREEVQARYGEVDDSGDLAALLMRYDELHGRVLQDFAGLSDEELDAPTLWWEGYAVPVRFRLHRFDAHLREHTIQAEKTLAWLDHAPSEAERLARLLYGALGAVEGALIGAPETLADRGRELAASIMARGEALAAESKA
jgi:hypothetical protein